MKKTFSLLLALVMSLLMCVPSMASETINSSDLEQMVYSFFETKEENFVSGTNISLKQYYVPEVAVTLDTETSSKLFEFEKQVRRENAADILNEDFSVTIEDISINGSTAIVDANEYYEYILSYSNGETSSRTTNFVITCEKINNTWKISGISTDNELEQLVKDIDNVPALFAVSAIEENEPVSDPDIERAHEQASTLKENADNTIHSNARTGYSFHWYSGVQALTYALEYSESTADPNDTAPYNNLFKPQSPNDCQNFVSQCVWAGLYGTNTSTAINEKQLPMITAASREWWATKTASCVNWTSIGYFTSYVTSGGEGTIGLVGAVGSAGQIANGYAGDMLHIRNSSGWYHTYIIVKATGTSGSRTNADYFVCAHTTNRRNETLKSIVGSSQSNLRLLTVSGSYY